MRKNILLRVVAGTVILLLAVCGCFLLWEANRPPEYLEFNQTQIPVEREVKKNPYAPEFFTMDGDGFVHYNGEDRTASLILDVSSHQGRIDWAQVASAGVDGVMIRAGYRGYGSVGNIMEDDYFRNNIQKASAAGLRVGVYFFSQAVNEDEAREEARFLLDCTADFDLSLPVAFDWERVDVESARTNGIGKEQLTSIACAFLDEVERGGQKPMLYFNRETAYLMYTLGDLTDYAFWLAEYDAYPSFYYDFAMWQYACVLTVPGIGGAVDTNLYFE